QGEQQCGNGHQSRHGDIPGFVKGTRMEAKLPAIRRFGQDELENLLHLPDERAGVLSRNIRY
ncbi:MAG: hypothetical protein ACM3U2_15090, partial [Deltaproteobacteria bacterium]